MGPDFWVFLPGIVLFGLLFGSFATALIYRIPRGLPWAWPSARGERMPRSACTHCGYMLRACDLVPVLSWLWLRGRCRRCREPIGMLYPLVELTTAAGCVAIYGLCGLSASSLVMMAAMPLLVALTVIDLQHYILPDVLNIMLAVLWFVSLAARLLNGDIAAEDLPAALAGGALSAIIYAGLIWLTGMVMRKILHKEALGMGDVKFFGVAGLWLGVTMLPWFMILAGLAGIGIGLIYRLALKKLYFPFGPALIVSFFGLFVISGLQTIDKTPLLYFPFSFLR